MSILERLENVKIKTAEISSEAGQKAEHAQYQQAQYRTCHVGEKISRITVTSYKSLEPFVDDPIPDDDSK